MRAGSRCLLVALLVPNAVAAGLPLLAAYPGCDYETLGEVQATDGRRPDGSADDARLRAANYARVLERMRRASEARGADAVVLRTHQAAFHMSNGQRSRHPVHVSITGLAIRFRDPARCRTTPIDAAALQERALQGQAEDVVLEARQPIL